MITNYDIICDREVFISMKKWQIILLIIISCYISYYSVFALLSLTSLDEQIITNISLVFWILPVPVYFFVIKRIIKKENDEVSKISLKIQKIVNLNESFNFKEITKVKRNITEREYSRKSLDRVTASSIIKYHIENNLNSLRSDIENALYNIDMLDNYINEVEKIINCESPNESQYSLKKFQKIENRVINNIIHKKEDFLIDLNLEVYYQSYGGRVNVSKHFHLTFNDLVNIYKEWQNGNKFAETKKQERRIMNDDIRYNVLKRDNYTCQICGVTAKDGAKLHVDHIIPVSEGGKTVMSNLQTLCDRCNLGKSNKTEEDFEKGMICPKCGGKLVKRKGKYGTFIGCANYPKCHYIKQTKKNYPTSKRT